MGRLGLGLIAAENFYKGYDEAGRRELDEAKRQAELSSLPDKTESERSGYKLRTATNNAGLETLPQQTANAKARLGLESGELAGQKERQPTDLAAKKAQSEIGLSNTQNDQANLPKTQEVRNNALQGQVLQSRSDLANLPDKLEAAGVQGAIGKQGQVDVVIGTLGQLIGGDDRQGALEFANNILARTGVFPSLKGKKFADIAPVQGGPNGDGYNFTTEDGGSIFIPKKRFLDAMGKLKTGEYQFIHDTHGNVWAGNKQTGVVTQTHKGDYSVTGKQHTPAEIQTMDWLINKGVAKNPAHAWEMVRSSREKTRTSFVADYVAKNALPNQDNSKLAEEAGKIYDSLKSVEPVTPVKINQEPMTPGSPQPEWNQWMDQ